MFDEMINDIKIDVVKILMNVEKAENLKREAQVQITNAALETLNKINIESTKPLPDNGVSHEPVVNHGPKVGRNDLCPCRKPVRNIKIAVERISKLMSYGNIALNYCNIVQSNYNILE